MEFFLISLLQDCSDGCSIREKLTSYEKRLKRNSKEKLAVQVLLTKSKGDVIRSMKTLLQDNFEKCLGDLEEWEKENSLPLLDPISRSIFIEPVILKESRNTYEKETISQWLSQKNTDPLTNQRLSDTSFISNHQVKSMVSEFIEKFVKALKDIIHFFVRVYPILSSFSDEEKMRSWISRMDNIIEDSCEFSRNRDELLEHVAVFYKTIGNEEKQKEVFEILLENFMGKKKHMKSVPILKDLIRLWLHDPDKCQRFIFLFLRCHEQLGNHSQVVRALIKFSKYLDEKTERNTLLRYQGQFYPKDENLLEYMTSRPVFSPQLVSHFLFQLSELKKNVKDKRLDLLEASLRICPDHHLARTTLLHLAETSNKEKCLDHIRYLHNWYQLRKRRKSMLRLWIEYDPQDDMCRRDIIKFELEDERYKQANVLIQRGSPKFGSWGTQLLVEHLSEKSKELRNLKEMMHKLMNDMSESRILAKYGVEDVRELVVKLGFEIVPDGIVSIFPKDEGRARRRKRREDDLIELLSSLNITRLDVSGLSLKAMERLELKKTMQSIQFDTLVMRKCHLGDQMNWMKSMDPTVLRVVDLSRNNMTVSGLEVVAKWMRKSIRLEKVGLADNMFGGGRKKETRGSSRSVDHLVGLLFEVESIKVMNLAGNHLEFLDIVWLVKVAGCRKGMKVTFDFSRNQVTKKEVETLACIARNCVIKIE